MYSNIFIYFLRSPRLQNTRHRLRGPLWPQDSLTEAYKHITLTNLWLSHDDVSKLTHMAVHTLSTGTVHNSIVRTHCCREFNSCRNNLSSQGRRLNSKSITQVTQQAAACHTYTVAKGTEQHIGTD